MLYSSIISGNKKRKKQLALKNPNKQNKQTNKKQNKRTKNKTNKRTKNKTNEQKTKQTNKETKTKNGDQ